MNANKVALRYVPEETWGVVPDSPAFKRMYFTSSDLQATKNTVESTTINQKRQVLALAEVGQAASHSLGYELSLGGAYDDMLSGALCNDWVVLDSKNGTSLVGSVTLNEGAKTITFSDSGDFGAYGRANVIRISGSTTSANDGVYLITGKDTETLTLTVLKDTTFVADGTGDNAELSLYCRYITNGVDLKSFTMEETFQGTVNEGDPNKPNVVTASGLVINTMSFSLATEAIVTGSIDMVGKEGNYSTEGLGGTTEELPFSFPVNTSSNIADLYIKGETSGLFENVGTSSIELNIANGMEAVPAIGHKTAYAMRMGKFQVTGTLTTIFENIEIAKAFKAHESLSLQVPFTDEDGNVMVLTIGKLKLSSGDPNVSGENTTVSLTSEFTAVMDDDQQTFQIDSIVAQ